MLRDWKTAGCPPFGARAPFLPRAAALCRRLCRFSEFSDGSPDFLEPIPSPPIRREASHKWKTQHKEQAKATHLKFIGRLNAAKDIVIYTDGSATPNPGRIGLGVSAMCGGVSTTYGKSIGIGSNITAELCAIHSAIKVTLQTNNLHNFNRVFIFSDCQTAIDLALKRSTITHSFEIVKNIHTQLELLQARIVVTILWVPAHVGVPGNEAADTAARNAASNVEGTSPILGQPLIPIATSRAFLKRAFKQQLQQRWFSTVAQKSNTEHLSRLRADVSAAPAFLAGTRKEQTILARLRFGSCNLNAFKSRMYGNVNEECECGEIETVRHFLLHCPRYASPRTVMMTTIRTIWQGAINEELLLGGGGARLPYEHWELVVSSVAKFVLSTKRSL